ncbi:MAG: hypothetical protein WCT03_23355 [Candidatus Obscuribacterales bacterium]|jgi:hypothetical protein
MSEQDLIFGVFDNPEQAAAVVAGLQEGGLASEQINFVAGDGEDVRAVAGRLRNPQQKVAIVFGGIGAVAGAIAGAYMAPAIPYAFSFQALTTMMAAVASALVTGYFAGIVGVLLASNQPPAFTNVYEAVLPKGKVIISAEIASHVVRAKAFEIMDSHGALEIVFQRSELAGTVENSKMVLLDSESPQELDVSAAA